MSDDASLGWRNAVRGAVGDLAGFIPGKILQSMGHFYSAPEVATIGNLGSVVGGILGAKYMTDKYSQGNAERIMKKKK